MARWKEHSVMIALGVALASPALAQDPRQPAPPDSAAEKASPAAEAALLPPIAIQHVRPADQRGINVFEPPKDDAVPFRGFRIDFGGSFTQQFQVLDHRNTAAPKPVTDASGRTYNANELIDIGWGFNLPTANLYLNAQLAPGIRVGLETYLTSRHHQEAWVKGGYLQIDESPVRHPLLEAAFEVLTIKVGMFPLNYGDAQFRRSDNGNALYNPFVGNLILDAWTFEPGAEIYLRKNGVLAMVGVTSGQNKGDVTAPERRGPAYLAKLGFDRQLGERLRLRLTGSYYRNDESPSSTLFWGDRAGSRYYLVMENTQATVTAQAWSGQLNPGFSNQVEALQVNPFVKIGGLELFGVIERATGKAAAEATSRTIHQYSGDVIYRFLDGEKLFVAGRYNVVNGEIPVSGGTYDVSVDRTQLAAGWFLTPTVVLKGEYVKQEYEDFPSSDIRNGGEFDGFVIEGVVSF